MKVPSGGDCGVTQGWAGLGPAGAHPRPAFWVTWVTLNVDALHNTVGTATLYGSTLAMAPGEAWTTMGRSPPSPPPPPFLMEAIPTSCIHYVLLCTVYIM